MNSTVMTTTTTDNGYIEWKCYQTNLDLYIHTIQTRTRKRQTPYGYLASQERNTIEKKNRLTQAMLSSEPTRYVLFYPNTEKKIENTTQYNINR